MSNENKKILDDIFKQENFIQMISVKTSSPAGIKTFNPGPIDVTEYIYFYSKLKKSFTFCTFDFNAIGSCLIVFFKIV